MRILYDKYIQLFEIAARSVTLNDILAECIDAGDYGALLEYYEIVQSAVQDSLYRMILYCCRILAGWDGLKSTAEADLDHFNGSLDRYTDGPKIAHKFLAGFQMSDHVSIPSA